ncbi:hypothetical protein [Parapedobacter pyrenivorans]|uniref:hypothetical protein n=1 Tax=Parapedobacter pyrenivorans TaxID=1305674 RepID=UPI0033419ED1
MKNTLIMLLSVVVLASCSNAPKSDGGSGEAAPLFALTNNPENPKYIALRLLDRRDGDTAITYSARAIYEQDTVGFTIQLDKDIPAGISSDGSVNEEAGFKTGTITFLRSGPESDRFVAALATLWKVEGVTRMKAQPVQPLAFSSNRAPVDHNKPFTNSFKLFFEENAPVPGEVFFTYDTYKKTIEFQEKGTQYRAQIVRTFGE